MKSQKAFDLITVITDIIFVLIIQFIIVMLIMIIPCTMTLFRELGGENGISQNAVNNLTHEETSRLVSNSVLITVVKGIAAMISIIAAPVIYERVQKHGEKGLSVSSREYLKGIVPDFGRLIKGSALGLVFAGAVIAESRFLHSGAGTDANISAALMISNIILIILLCFSRELLFRYYIHLKVSKVDEMVFYFVSNILFVAVEGITVGFSSFGNILTILLISVLMTVWSSRNKGIYQNVGFRAVSEVILFTVMKDRYAFSVSGTLILLTVITAEILMILRKKGKCDEVIQEISK